MTESQTQDTVLKKIKIALLGCTEVEVAWLYGSRAKGNAQPHSDFDIALALYPEYIGNLQLLDDIRFQLQQLSVDTISVIDIDRIPVPLAFNVIETSELLLCRSDLRLRKEQQRIWSLWESYEHQHEKYRTGL